MTGFLGTFWMTMFSKNILLDQRNTALEPMCEVARNSPDGAKSIEIGALRN